MTIYELHYRQTEYRTRRVEAESAEQAVVLFNQGYGDDRFRDTGQDQIVFGVDEIGPYGIGRPVWEEGDDSVLHADPDSPQRRAYVTLRAAGLAEKAGV